MISFKIRQIIKRIIFGPPPPPVEIPPTPLFTKDNLKYQKYDIGTGTYGEPRIWDWNDGATLNVGKYCSIAGVTILLGGEHPQNRVSTYPFESIRLKLADEDFENASDRFSKGDVNIGNDVWLGEGCMILSGVTIGDGAIVGAAAVVSKNVPPYAIVAGNPARIIKYRFSPDIIEQLLQIKWWDCDEEAINKMDFSLSVDHFIELYFTRS